MISDEQFEDLYKMFNYHSNHSIREALRVVCEHLCEELTPTQLSTDERGWLTAAMRESRLGVGTVNHRWCVDKLLELFPEPKPVPKTPSELISVLRANGLNADQMRAVDEIIKLLDM